MKIIWKSHEWNQLTELQRIHLLALADSHEFLPDPEWQKRGENLAVETDRGAKRE